MNPMFCVVENFVHDFFRAGAQFFCFAVTGIAYTPLVRFKQNDTSTKFACFRDSLCVPDAWIDRHGYLLISEG